MGDDAVLKQWDSPNNRKSQEHTDTLLLTTVHTVCEANMFIILVLIYLLLCLRKKKERLSECSSSSCRKKDQNALHETK